MTTTTTTTATKTRKRAAKNAPAPVQASEVAVQTQAQRVPAAPATVYTEATTIARAALKERLALVRGAVGKKSLPILEYVLLQAQASGKLRVAATNLALANIVFAEAAVEEAWALCVPFKLLADVVEALPDAPITLRVDTRSQTLNLRCEAFEINIKGLEADEFPAIPSIATDKSVWLPGDSFVKAVRQVAPAVADEDDSRPALTSVLIESTSNMLTLVAADGYRLTRRRLALEDAGDTFSALLPGAAAERIADIVRRIDDGQDEEVTLAVDSAGRYLQIAAAGATCIARLLEGKFPDYERVLPKEYRTRVVLDTAELKAALKLARFFAAQSAHMVKLTMAFDNTTDSGITMTLATNATEAGDNLAALHPISAEGEHIQIALDVRYLIDAVNAVQTSRVAFEFSGPLLPAVLHPVADKDGAQVDDLTCVLMPKQVR